MVNICNNNITMNRGDSFVMPVIINYGTKFDPLYYTLTKDDTVYFALEEYNQRFEDAILKRVYDGSDSSEGGLTITLKPSDTEFLLPGEYFYEIKLKHIYYDEFERPHEYVYTIVPRKKFIILE